MTKDAKINNNIGKKTLLHLQTTNGQDSNALSLLENMVPSAAPSEERGPMLLTVLEVSCFSIAPAQGCITYEKESKLSGGNIT